MLKLIGCMVLATGFFLIGMYKSKELLVRKRELEKIVKLIEEVEVLTDFQNYSVKEIFYMLEKQPNGFYPDTVCEFNRLIENTEQPEALKTAVSNTCHGLNTEDKRLFSEFLLSLGKTDRELQLKSCRKYSHSFEVKLIEAKSKYTANGSLYKKLGLLSALMTVIVII